MLCIQREREPPKGTRGRGCSYEQQTICTRRRRQDINNYTYRRNIPDALQSSSDKEEELDRSLEEHKSLRRSNSRVGEEEEKPLVVKYVDDILGAEKVYSR